MEVTPPLQKHLVKIPEWMKWLIPSTLSRTYHSLVHPNIRSSHKQLSFLLANAAPPFLLRRSRRFLPGPPEVRWHGALRSQLLGVGVQGVVRKRSAEGRPESARVTAGAQALTARHAPPSSACHPFWTLHSLAKHTGHRVTTASYDPMLQIHDWGIRLKEKGQNCDVRSMLRRPGFKILCQQAPIYQANATGSPRWPWMWYLQQWRRPLLTMVFPISSGLQRRAAVFCH